MRVVVMRTLLVVLVRKQGVLLAVRLLCCLQRREYCIGSEALVWTWLCMA